MQIGIKTLSLSHTHTQAYRDWVAVMAWKLSIEVSAADLFSTMVEYSF